MTEVEYFNGVSGIVGEYWQARRQLSAAYAAARSNGGQADTVSMAIEGVGSSLWALGEATPATPRAAAEMLGVALDALPRPCGAADPLGMVATTFDGADILAIVRRVRDAMELWETPIATAA